MKQIGLALHNYLDVHRTFPSPTLDDPAHSWRVAILPYLDQPVLFKQYQFDSAWDGPENSKIASTSVSTYFCWSSPRRTDDQKRYLTCYVALTGPHAIWTPTGPRQLNDIPDGASQTAMVVEACGLNIVWTEPRDIDVESTPVAINLPGDTPDASPAMFSSYHPRGVHVLMADGSVRRVPLHTDPKILQAMITADGGEALP